MKLGISEILTQVSKLEDEAARIQLLQNNASPPLYTVLQSIFDPTIVWLLPETDPPYKPCDLVDQEHVFFTEYRKMYLFVQGGAPDLKQLRREALFIELLERLAPEDAKLLLTMKNKHLPYPGITRELVLKAFPGLFA